MLDEKGAALVKRIGAAAALLFVIVIIVSGKLPSSFDAIRNHLERNVEYFSGRSARTELHHASSANTWGGRMATFNVSTAAQLSAALASAHAGDTILLASGTYSGLVLKNVHFSSAVTITSADLAHPATITDLIVNSCSGLTFSNLEVDESSSTVTNPFQILSSSNIQLSHLWIHGSLDNNPSDDPAGLFIRNSDHITVSGCEFEQLWHGAGFLDSNYLQFTRNSFHDIRSDGIRGGGSSFVTISDNSFTDFFPNFAAGDHPDAIQFWTTNTTASAHDITITDNVISRGTGAAVQGIFLRDQVGNLPYENVSITGNMLVGTAFNG